MSPEELKRRFTYHKPSGNQPERYEEIRGMGRTFATRLYELCPESRELSLALAKLEEVVMWANAAIARRENKVPEPENTPCEQHLVIARAGNPMSTGQVAQEAILRRIADEVGGFYMNGYALMAKSAKTQEYGEGMELLCKLHRELVEGEEDD